MLNKGAFALEIVRGDPELTADCRVTLNRGDRIGSLDCIWAWRPSWSCDLDHLYKLLCLHMKFGFDWPSGFRGEDL